jgi:hypothetical protein
MKKLLLMGAALWLTPGLQAQSFTDYDWPEAFAPKAEIPQDFQSAEAVIVKYEEYNKSTFSGTFPYIEQLALQRTQTHYKIQSEAALKDLKRLVIPKLKGRIADFVQVKYVDVRIRKGETGEVKDLSVRKLPEITLVEGDELYSQREDVYVYEIPDLAVGDELEQIVLIEAKFANDGGSVNLYKSYPVMEGIYTISIPNSVKLDGRIYNGMPKEEVKVVGDQKVYKWRVQNLPAVPEANSSGSIFAKDLGYFVYELNFDAFREFQASFKVANWSDLILLYSEDFLQPVVARKKVLVEWYEKNIFKGKKAEEISSLEKVFNLQDYLSRNMKLIGERDLQDGEKSQGIEYFLANKKATYRTIMCVYRDFFDRYNIPYYLAIGKNRFNGPFDMDFVSNSQVSNYFFVVNIPDKGNFVIDPMSGFNEIPAGLLGTTCLMRDIKTRKAELQQITFPEDGLKQTNTNKRLQRSQVQVDAQGNMTKKVALELSGFFSPGRSSYISASKADTLDKFLSRVYSNVYKDQGKVSASESSIKKWDNLDPFPFRVEYTLKMTDFFKKVDDKTWELNFENWLGHSLRNVANPEKRVLDYYLPFSGSDVDDVVFNFEQEVVLDNAKDLSQKIQTEAGTYELRVMQLNAKAIRLESRYTINTIYLPKDKVKALDEINKGVEKMDKAKLVFKFK